MVMEGFKIEKKTSCKHNTEIGIFCESCFAEAKKGQSIWPEIEKIHQTSKTKRAKLETNCTIEVNEKNFEIKTITSKDDPALEKVFILLEKEFKEDELNTRESFKQKLEGLTKSGEKRPAYRCFYVEDENKNVIAARVSENFPLLKEDGSETKENVFYGLYIVIEKEYRGTGIARELYLSALIDSLIESQKEGKDLTALIAECTPASEKLMNLFNLKKIFFKEGNKFTEFQYYQPAIEFNTETGEKITGEIAEHIMMHNIEKKGSLNKEIFNQILFSLYKQYENNYPEKSFKNKEAFSKYKIYYQNLIQGIKNKTENTGELVQLNIAEQEELKEKGFEILNFEEANNR